MIVRLMHQHSTVPNAPSCAKLATLLGRQEQLHNDYVNLTDEEVNFLLSMTMFPAGSQSISTNIWLVIVPQAKRLLR